jgi:cytochrome c
MHLRAALIALSASAAPALAQVKPLPPPPPMDDAALLARADAAAGERVWRTCRACHGVEAGRHGIGPSLHGIVGAPIGVQPGFRYSQVLANRGGTWTVAALSEFLENPRATAPGTTMAFAGIRAADDRLNLIAWLATQAP